MSGLHPPRRPGLPDVRLDHHHLGALVELAFVMRASRALYAAAELNIADFLASGPLTTAELAAAVGADAAALRRLMRALVAHGVFEEEIGDSFRLNAAGELMRRDVPGSQRAAVLFTAGDIQWRLWSDFLECVRTGRAVVERVFGAGAPTYVAMAFPFRFGAVSGMRTFSVH